MSCHMRLDSNLLTSIIQHFPAWSSMISRPKNSKWSGLLWWDKKGRAALTSDFHRFETLSKVYIRHCLVKSKHCGQTQPQLTTFISYHLWVDFLYIHWNLARVIGELFVDGKIRDMLVHVIVVAVITHSSSEYERFLKQESRHVSFQYCVHSVMKFVTFPQRWILHVPLYNTF